MPPSSGTTAPAIYESAADARRVVDPTTLAGGAYPPQQHRRLDVLARFGILQREGGQLALERSREVERRPDTRVGGQRRGKLHAVQTVVDGAHDALDGVVARDQLRDERQREVAVRDRLAERRSAARSRGRRGSVACLRSSAKADRKSVV